MTKLNKHKDDKHKVAILKFKMSKLLTAQRYIRLAGSCGVGRRFEKLVDAHEIEPPERAEFGMNCCKFFRAFS